MRTCEKAPQQLLTERSVYARVHSSDKTRNSTGRPRCQYPELRTRPEPPTVPANGPRCWPQALRPWRPSSPRAPRADRRLRRRRLTIASPGQSGHMGHRRRTTSRSPTASRPEKGATLQLYSYADYISPDAIKSFEDKYGDQGRGLDVQRHRRGDHQDPRRQRRLRHLLPELRPDQPAGQRRAGAAAEPHLHPEHQERLADLHQPLVRPGVALHRAVHRLHHRHRLAHRPGARRHRRAEEPVRRRSGIRSTRTRPRSSTTGTPRWRWCCCKHGITDINTSSADDLKMVGEQLDRAGGGDLAEGHHHDVQRPARRPDRAVADVVGRHHQRPVTTCPRASSRTSCATGSPPTARAWSTTT